MNKRLKHAGGLSLICVILLGMMTVGQTGCSVYRKFKSPDLKAMVVEKVDVKLAGQSSEAAKLDVTLTINNPNGTALPLVKTDMTVSIGSLGQASTQYLLHRTVPANGTQTITIPVVILTSEQITAGTSFSAKGVVSYEPPGELRKLMTESNVPLPAVVFDLQGQM